MPRFVFETVVEVAPELLFAWHEQRGAFFRLIPPWTRAQVLRYDGLRVGSRAVIRVPVGPTHLDWSTEIREVDRGRSFTDVQVRGPFRRWEHVHTIRSLGDGSTQLVDSVDVDYPRLARVAGPVERRLTRLIDRGFAYRHTTIFNDLQRIRQYTYTQPLRVAVSGSSGLIGSALVDFLDAAGHEVYRLVRYRPRQSREIHFDPEARTVDAESLEGIDAFVHLGGDSMAVLRWNDEKRARIRSSRIDSTRFLVETLLKLRRRPLTVLTASTLGIYGDRPGETLEEDAPIGTDGFLPELGREWEEAVRPLTEAGVRTAQLRFGLIVSPANPIIRLIMEPIRLGVGARIRGRNTDVSWISIDDALYAIYHILSTGSVRGPVNMVSPEPSSRRALIESLARTVSNRIRIAIPEPTVRFVMGDVADEFIFQNQRARPARLLESGFAFSFPALETALLHQFGYARPPQTRPRVRRALVV